LPLAAIGSSCGAKTDLDREDAPGPEVPSAEPEICDGLDNDLDGEVDESFRDGPAGAYNHLEHCGMCGLSCVESDPHAVSSSCVEVRTTVWACRPDACDPGYAPSADGSRCVPWAPVLCLPCLEDGDCRIDGGRCERVGEDLRCTAPCGGGAPLDATCPEGYGCSDGRCLPSGGSCDCGPGDFFAMSCPIETPEGEICLGLAVCRDGVLSACAGRDEVCDGEDNDCDGEFDEDYRDELGEYSVDVRNCGACGVDCTETVLPGMELTCGGDPYAPRCRILCADEVDGVQVGDRLDADLDITNGCECSVSAIEDEAGPFGAFGEELDVNCDGADGIVRRSWYVVRDGDDTHPGSPLYPLLTIGEAIRRAEASFETTVPKPDIFVAAGTYLETVRVPNGVHLYGGYRADFLGLVPESFVVSVVAGEDAGPGNAALVLLDGAGAQPTIVSGIQFRGGDASGAGMPAFGAHVTNPGPHVTFRRIWIRSGQGGPGSHGAHGPAGTAAPANAGTGTKPRTAVEDAMHTCLRSADNRVAGGTGARNVCGGTDVSGGDGGAAGCPTFMATQPAGSPGRSGGTGVPGGTGGSGGWDSSGPGTHGCDSDVCCGVYTVPETYEMAGDGRNGGHGTPGTAGVACADPLGDLDGETWTPGDAGPGTRGGPGAGGGGGGAGGGTEMTFYATDCPHPDGLGGGGGGGGAGGCGGEGGTPGTSGAPSIGMVIEYRVAGRPAPVFEDVRIRTGAGGLGGRGGAGGDGGLGSAGAAGGDLTYEEREIPLSGVTRGATGGTGGTGGPGGGGGGGCGGSSVGVWALLHGNPDPGVAAAVAAGTTVTSAGGGTAGPGGAGAVPGADGAAGEVRDVVVE
jgi:hypothetical protein